MSARRTASKSVVKGYSSLPPPGVVYNDNCRQNVYKAVGWAEDGTFVWNSGNGYDIQGYRTFSTWLKASGTNNYEFAVHIETNVGRKGLRYHPHNSIVDTSPDGLYRNIGIHGKAGDYDAGKWVRLERDMLADAKAAWGSSVTITRVTGITVWSNTGGTTWMDGLSFSNSLTVEQNVLARGILTHIMRNRTIDPSNYSIADSWFHYDQVGSVMLASNAVGSQQTAHYQDAWGNVLQSWQTGRWDGNANGWHHNTKATDGDLGLVYMYQRWYVPELTIFGAKTIFPPMLEHPYGYALNDPLLKVDPEGEIWIVVPIFSALLNCGLGMLNVIELSKCLKSCERSVQILEANKDKLDPNTYHSLLCESYGCKSDCLNAIGGSLSYQSLLCAASVIGIGKFPKGK